MVILSRLRRGNMAENTVQWRWRCESVTYMYNV